MTASASAMRSLLVGAEDTIAAIASAQGRGAIALLRLSGSAAQVIGLKVLPEWSPEDRRPSLVSVHDPSTGALIDRAVVTLFAGPRSYTGEDLIEISVHGGALVPALVLHALLAAGARQALPGEFTRRAVMAGKLDVLQAEAVADLVDAHSRAMHGAALQQLDGALSRHIDALREGVLDLEALIAYDIDFPEEDEGPIARERITRATDRVLEMLDTLLGTARTGELIRQGAVIVIAGAPNVGKSSLFNALLGATRAIVTDIPGTTRDAIEAVIELGAWPARLVDTAGLREAHDVVERLGIEVSEQYLSEADLVLVVGDAPDVLAEAIDHVRALTEVAIVRVQTKVDLVPNSYELPVDLGSSGDEITHRVSAKTGKGLDELALAIGTELEGTYGSRTPETPLLTRERHREAISRARGEVGDFRARWEEGALPAPVAAVHLRAAASALEELVGVVDVEDVLDRVFRSFCVGK